MIINKKGFFLTNIFNSKPPSIDFNFRHISSFLIKNRGIGSFSEDIREYCATIKAELKKILDTIATKIEKRIKSIKNNNTNQAQQLYQEYQAMMHDFIKNLDDFTNCVIESSNPNASYESLGNYLDEEINNLNILIKQIYSI